MQTILKGLNIMVSKPEDNNYKRLRREAGLSQKELSELLGVHQTAVSQWECGRTEPDVRSLKKLAALYSVTLDSLLVGTAEAAADPEKYEAVRRRVRAESRRVPILGSVQAGVPVSAIEDVVGYVGLDEDCEPDGGEFFALRVRGSSMEPRFMEGDTVIVRRQDDAESGDVVVALTGDEATIKQLRKRDDGVLLVPFNNAFEPLFFTRAETESLPLRILGKVVELRAKV